MTNSSKSGTPFRGQGDSVTSADTEPASGSVWSRVAAWSVRHWAFVAIASLTFLADCCSKAWVENFFAGRDPLAEPIVLIPNRLALTLTYNTGAAWGILRDASNAMRLPIFFAVSGLAAAFVISLYRKASVDRRALRLGLALVLGGALGNLLDRTLRVGVVDFVQYRGAWVETMNRGIRALKPDWVVTDHWPVFNVADVAICIGVVLLLVDGRLSRRRAGTSQARRRGKRVSSGATS